MNPKIEALQKAARERMLAKQNQLDSQSQPNGNQENGHNNLGQDSLINSPQTLENALIQKWGFNPYVMDNGLILNENQRKAVDWFGLDGKSGCLIGPAGTGKTTTMKAVIRAAVLSNRIPIIQSEEEHKFIPTGVPGIWGGSFTRIATRNLKDNFPPDLKGNVHTIHRLIEFEPSYKEVINPETGDIKSVRIFVPTRNKNRTLPKSYQMLNFDESSMVGTDLHKKVEEALSDKRRVQFLYIGDIAQLPPVMDDSVLGYKLLELPTVELTEVYRHAGAIVNLANHIRVGNTIPYGPQIIPFVYKPTKIPKKILEAGLAEWNKEEDGSKVTIHLWKNRLEGEIGQLKALQSLGDCTNIEKKQYGFFPKELMEGNYDPMKHMILMPYNKSVGTIELNRYIAEFIARKKEKIVHEVIGGYEKHYFAVGDKIFFDREEAIITKINKNGNYMGKIPQPASVSLNRWGHNRVGVEATMDEDEFSSIDALMKKMSTDDDEERKNQASHSITLKKLLDIKDNNETDYTIQTAAEINNLLFGYALTIHKSQGSQWEKVYCIFHCSHNRNLQRELLYTAITRAQKELYIICEPETFIQGVMSQHIIGNTLAEKAEYFKGKKDTKEKLEQKQKELALQNESNQNENEDC